MSRNGPAIPKKTANLAWSQWPTKAPADAARGKCHISRSGNRFRSLPYSSELSFANNLQEVTTMRTETPIFEPLISATEAAQLLGIHPVTILRWARKGRIPHLRLGRKVKFRVSELNSWSSTNYTDSAVRVAQP